MKAQKRRKAKVLAAILSTAVLAVYGCGGGGGGGGGGGEEKTPATLTSSNAPTAASGAIQAISLAGLGESLSGVAAAKGLAGTSSIGGNNQGRPLTRILNIALSSTDQYKVRSAAPGAPGNMPQQTMACPGPGADGISGTSDDGTMTISASWSDMNASTGDYKDFSATISSSNCVEGTETLNGSMTLSVSGWLSLPTGITLTANMTFVDTKGTTTITDDDNLTLTNLTMSLTGITRDTTTGEITAATISITGTISGMESGKAVNLGFDGFTLTFSSNSSGETVSISGSLYVPCVGGWVTITTLTPVFTPAGSPCPTSGDIKITSGGNTVEVVFEAGCNVTVTFNGTAGFRNFTGLEGQCS